MATNIIEEKLKTYKLEALEDELHALKEILQEIALYGLASAGFFDKAIFQGGTALRILYGLPRFSEDLDFLLKMPDPDFNWKMYINAVADVCKAYGVHPDITDKSNENTNVKKMFLKDDSIGKIINLSYPHHPGKKITIKFEIDTNPPLGSKLEVKFLEFPLDFSIISQDLASSFAGKCHALLCREYIKGRDWYGFSWYVSKKVVPNMTFLENALFQMGPWKNQHIAITQQWFHEAMKNKINSIDWDKAVADVTPFLNRQDRQALKLWGVDFFMSKLNKMVW